MLASNSKCQSCASAILLALLWTPGVWANHGGDHRWTNPNGGLWGDTGSWNPASVPGPDDTAIFDLADETYTVGLEDLLGISPVHAETRRLIVGDDDVTFSMGAFTGNGSYTATATFPPSVSVVIGNGFLDDGSLTIDQGTLSGQHVVIGNEVLQTRFTNRATGTLNVDGAESLVEIADEGRLVVGYKGRGTLNLANGGDVFADGTLAEYDVDIGSQSTGIGTVNIDGMGGARGCAGSGPFFVFSPRAGCGRVVECLNGTATTYSVFEFNLPCHGPWQWVVEGLSRRAGL